MGIQHGLNAIRCVMTSIASGHPCGLEASSSVLWHSVPGGTIFMHLKEDLFSFTLKISGRNGAVHAALFGSFLLPPPASRPAVFAFFCFPGAGGAADTGEPFFIKGMLGNIVNFGVFDHFLFGPVCERVQFYDAVMVVVKFCFINRCARSPLVAA